MADFNPLTIPAIMPSSVARTKEGGKPTQAMVDWEQALQAWMKANVANTNERINEVSEEVGDVAASVVTETEARIDGDEALASTITTVDAKADSATASGAVFLSAKAAPSGATAAYGWYLTAGTAFAGMEAVALSGGGSAIGFTANKFFFTDSGTAQQAFSYSGGLFYFNVPIVIQSGASGARQVITKENTKIYDSSNVLRVAMGINI